MAAASVLEGLHGEIGVAVAAEVRVVVAVADKDDAGDESNSAVATANDLPCYCGFQQY